MAFEVEQKYRVDDLEQIERKLAELGAQFEGPSRQIDEYYAHPARDFAQTDEALRIRRVGQANRVTYKGPKLDAQTKTRREIEIPFAEGDKIAAQMAELLAALGFKSVREVRKNRRKSELRWEGHNVEIALDDVADLGNFLELEVIAEEAGLPAARACIASLAARLGLSESERRSYLELLLAREATV